MADFVSLQEEDLAMIAAQQILVQFGPSEPLKQEKLLTLLPSYIPDYCLTSSEKALSRWANLITQAYKKVASLWSSNTTRFLPRRNQNYFNCAPVYCL